MSAKIRLKRFGSKRRPYYRIVVMDTLGPRDGEALDEVGQYHPIEGEAANQVRFDEEKVRAWLDKGAQPTHTVRKLLNRNQFTVR